MKHKRALRWRTFIVLLAVLACAGNWATGQVSSVRDRSDVAKLTEKKRTVCVGRYFLDVPLRAQVSLSGGMIDGFDNETTEESEAAFDQRVAACAAAIEARGADNKGGFLFDRSRRYLMDGDRRIDMESVSVEVHAHVGGSSFSLSATSAEASAEKSAEALLARLRLRGVDEIPAVSGFCVWRGVFADPLPAHKMLTRVAATDAAIGTSERLRICKLRVGIRGINGLDGAEVVERIRAYNFVTTYAFNWDARSQHGDVTRPYLSLDMQAGMSRRTGGSPTALRPQHAPGPPPEPSG